MKCTKNMKPVQFARISLLSMSTKRPGLEVIKLEFIVRLKIKRNDWLIADMCPQAANHCALFESETVLKFYNLEACSSGNYNASLKLRKTEVNY